MTMQHGDIDPEIDAWNRERKADDRYKKWQERVAASLPKLTERGIALRHTMYDGCGFHYAKECTLGRAWIIANDYEGKAWHPQDKWTARIINRLTVERLFRDVVEAEKSAAEWKKTHP